jgi:hypothetical protein
VVVVLGIGREGQPQGRGGQGRAGGVGGHAMVLLN